jgi:probable selenium-dependent hydroxylase accessory protein YqeC
MNLIQALRLEEHSRIAFVGAGGKTSTISRIAREYSKNIIISTTTHMGTWQVHEFDVHMTGDQIKDLAQTIKTTKKNRILFTSGLETEERIKGLSILRMRKLSNEAAKCRVPMLIEADGSRQLLVKAPERYEPVIPRFVDTVVVVTNLDCLGKLNKDGIVHRPGIFSKLTQCGSNEQINKEHLIRLFLHPKGGLKNIQRNASRIALFTNCTGQNRLKTARAIANVLTSIYSTVILLKENEELEIVERSAGIILAAGGSTRFQTNKLLADWHGVPLIRHTTQNALRSALDSVSVVLGNKADQLRNELKGLPVQTLINRRWKRGISSSIKVGIKGLRGQFGCLVIVQADQPFLSSEVINALLKRHAMQNEKIVAPEANGERCTPTLFDNSLFRDLCNLKGDKGGSQLFNKIPPVLIPWNDARLALDIDTPADFLWAKELNKTT